MRQVWAELHGEILEVVDSGEVVVSVIRWHLRGRSGVELDAVEGWVTCIRDQIGRCRGQRGELRGNGGAQDIAR